MPSDNKPKPKRGRPPLPLPEAINRPMDEIAAVVLSKPPKREDEWRYMRERKAERERRSQSDG